MIDPKDNKLILLANERLLMVMIAIDDFELSVCGPDGDITQATLTGHQAAQYIALLRAKEHAMVLKHDLLENLFEDELRPVNILTEQIIKATETLRHEKTREKAQEILDHVKKNTFFIVKGRPVKPSKFIDDIDDDDEENNNG